MNGAAGERVFFGGINGNDDAFEQPFDSLGIVYKYFPTDRLELDFNIDNLLDDVLKSTQVNSNDETATIINGVVDMTFSVGAKLVFWQDCSRP